MIPYTLITLTLIPSAQCTVSVPTHPVVLFMSAPEFLVLSVRVVGAILGLFWLVGSAKSSSVMFFESTESPLRFPWGYLIWKFNVFEVLGNQGFNQHELGQFGAKTQPYFSVKQVYFLFFMGWIYYWCLPVNNVNSTFIIIVSNNNKLSIFNSGDK